MTTTVIYRAVQSTCSCVGGQCVGCEQNASSAAVSHAVAECSASCGQREGGEGGGAEAELDRAVEEEDYSSCCGPSTINARESARMSSCGLTSPYMNRRPDKGESYEPTYFEHIANVLSHGIGIVPSIIAFYYIVDSAHRELQYILMLIYGLFTTMLFFASTMYHFCEMLYRPLKQRSKLRYYLHICDRAVIYLFIAASYTPWLTLRHCGYPGLNLKWMIWLFAVVGILYQYNFHEKYKTIELALYIAVAGLPSVAIFTMNDRSGLELMVAGGLVYVVGVVFFKLDGVVPFAHAIWHVHVLIGAAVHTYAVYATLLGPDANNPVPDVGRLPDGEL